MDVKKLKRKIKKHKRKIKKLRLKIHEELNKEHKSYVSAIEQLDLREDAWAFTKAFDDISSVVNRYNPY